MTNMKPLFLILLLEIIQCLQYIDQDLQGKMKLVSCIYLTRDRLSKDEDTFFEILNSEKIDYLKYKDDITERNDLMQIILLHCQSRISIEDAALVTSNYKIKKLDALEIQYRNILDLENIAEIYKKKDTSALIKEIEQLNIKLKNLQDEIDKKTQKKEEI